MLDSSLISLWVAISLYIAHSSPCAQCLAEKDTANQYLSMGIFVEAPVELWKVAIQGEVK